MDIEAPESQAVVTELDLLAKEFKRLLNVETSVMETRSADALPSLVDEKNQVVTQLQSKEATLIGLFSEFPENDSVQKLKQTLTECQQLNRQNQNIALVELKHTQNSLELLRSLLKLDDLPLYSSEGQIKVKREKRNFGSA